MDKHNKHIEWKETGSLLLLFTLSFLFLLLLHSCARMGQPDGGWYDETPPKVVGANPDDHATNVHRKHIYINFDEFITIDNPTENVVARQAHQCGAYGLFEAQHHLHDRLLQRHL